MFRTFPRLILPDDVLSFEGETFLKLVNQTCENVFEELMEVLSINTVHKLLLVEKNVLSVLEKNYRVLEKIIQRACLHLVDNTIMLESGIRLDFNRLTEALHAIIDQNQQQERTTSSNNDFVSLFRTLMKSSDLNESDDS